MQILPKEKGQGLIEYALIIILVAMVVLMMFTVFGPSVGNVFSNVIANF
jgi:pilus assembly protein Flp/PilA